MEIPFTLFVVASSAPAAESFLQGLRQGHPHIQMTNKYFSGYVTGTAHSFSSFREVEKAEGVVLLLSPDEAEEGRSLLSHQQALLETAEVQFVFSSQECEELRQLALEFDMEYEWQDYARDSSLTREDEKVGLARVLEAVEVGCAPLAQRPSPPPEPQENGGMDDIEVFEELMEKIRLASESAVSLSDEDRRKQAERVILEVAQRLGIDES